ncbi:MAG: ATP-binding protein, partial [Schlesneria sp.]
MPDDPNPELRDQDFQSRIFYHLVEKIAASEQHVQNIFNSLHDGVLEIDATGKILFSNAAASKQLGFSSEELKSKSIQDFLTIPFCEDRFCDHFNSPNECQIRLSSEELIWCSICANTSSHGMITVTIHQIEERKQEESRRRKLERNLRKINKQLKIANQRKNDILAMVGHEFRNPLSVMQNALAVFTERRVTADQQYEAAKLLNWQLQKLKRYLDDLLDSIRVDSNALQMNRTVQEIGAILRRSIESTKKTFSDKNLQLQFIIPQTPVIGFVDDLRLEQVFENLLTNAAKWSYPNGRVIVHVDESEGDIVIRIVDNGSGFSEEFAPSLFKKYRREHPKAATSGFGIGLSLCKAIVKLHGGTISGHSDGPGYGAEFRIRLPAYKRRPSGALEPSLAGGGSSVKKQAIVVDDYPEAAESLAVLLRIRGFEVVTAKDGAEAIQRIKDSSLALAFIDIGLPVVDGFEVARQVRQEIQNR